MSEALFVGLKFAIRGEEFCGDFSWVKHFGVDFLGVDKTAQPRFLILCQTIVSISFTNVNYICSRLSKNDCRLSKVFGRCMMNKENETWVQKLS